MQVSLPDGLQREIESLAEQFGVPITRTVAIGTQAFWRWQARTRTCEVCMVVRRPSRFAPR